MNEAYEWLAQEILWMAYDRTEQISDKQRLERLRLLVEIEAPQRGYPRVKLEWPFTVGHDAEDRPRR